MLHFKGPDIHKALSHFRSDTSVLQLVVDSLREGGDKTFLFEHQTDKSVTFAEFLQLSNSVAAGLIDVGVKAGDVVVLCCDKNILSHTLFMGILFIGATAVIAPIPHADILDKLTSKFEVKAVFCEPKYLASVNQSVSNMKTKPILVVSTDPTDPTIQYITTCEKGFAMYEVKDANTHISLVLFTSGTTGIPKGVQMSDIALQSFWSFSSTKTTQSSFLAATPLFWYSSISSFFRTMCEQYIYYLTDSNDVKQILQLIEKHKVESWFTGTGSLVSYINEPSLHNFDLSSLKYVYTGGELLLDSVSREFEAKVLRGRVNLSTVYATTECGMISTKLEETPGSDRMGYCGKILPGVEIKILDEDGQLVSPGCLGELWVKSIAVTPGYWGMPQLNSTMFDKEGFFRNGDAGFFSHDGSLFLSGRTCDLINFRGTKFPPAELEDLIMSHPSVMSAAVVGRAHPSDIQHATAFIVRRPGLVLTEKEIVDFINDQVSDTKRLRGGAHFLDVLPKTIIGKVIRKQLREHDYT